MYIFKYNIIAQAQHSQSSTTDLGHYPLNSPKFDIFGLVFIPINKNPASQDLKCQIPQLCVT